MRKNRDPSVGPGGSLRILDTLSQHVCSIYGTRSGYQAVLGDAVQRFEPLRRQAFATFRYRPIFWEANATSSDKSPTIPMLPARTLRVMGVRTLISRSF